jgi:hypothetical protein
MPKVRKTTSGSDGVEASPASRRKQQQFNKIVNKSFEQPQQQTSVTNIMVNLEVCSNSDSNSADGSNNFSSDFQQTYFALPPLDIKDELPDFEDDVEDKLQVDPDGNNDSRTRSENLQITLRSHIETHKTDATFVCELCPKASLCSHKHPKHGLTKSDCVCQICNKRYTTLVHMISKISLVDYESFVYLFLIV